LKNPEHLTSPIRLVSSLENFRHAAPDGAESHEKE